MNSSDGLIVFLFALGACCVVYQLGKNKGNNEGYKRAQVQHSQWIDKVTADSAALQAENARLSQENGSLRKENDIVKNLLRQQPTTPEAEAILKAVGRVELQLTQILPSAFEDGENHDTALN